MRHHAVSTLLLCTRVLAAQEGIRPLAIDDALTEVEFSSYVPVSLSPEGRLVTYTTIHPRNRGTVSAEESWRDESGIPRVVSGGAVWITDLASSRSERVSPMGSSSYGGVWSPDGRRLAFISDSGGVSRVWIWGVTDRRAKPIPSAVTRTFGPWERPVWMPDGQHVLVKLRPAARMVAPAPKPLVVVLASAARDSAGRVPRDTGVNTIVQRWLTADLGLLNVETGRVRIVDSATGVSGIWPSPDGRRVLYARRRGGNAAPGSVYDLVLWSQADGGRRVLAREVPHSWGHNASWSPDGKRVAFYASGSLYSTGEVDAAVSRRAGCWVVPVDGGAEREVCGTRSKDVSSGIDPPQWTADGSALLVPTVDTLWRIDVADSSATRLAALPGRITGSRTRHDGTALVAFRDERTMHEGLALVDQSGTLTIVTAGAQAIARQTGFGRTLAQADFVDSSVVFVSQSTDRPEELWHVYRGGAPRRLTRLNAHLDGYRFDGARLIEWLTDDGKPATGVLFLPARWRAGERYPLIVRAYPDQRALPFAYRFGGYRSMNHVQLYTTRGYAVLYADAARAGAAPMIEIAKAVLPGVNRVIELGVADGDRLALIGHSFAGYAALSLLVLTNRFKAAVIESSTGNLIAGAHQLVGTASMNQWAEEGQGMMRGSLWEVRERYVESSPLFYLDRSTTPVLLLHGELDDVSVKHADELFVALRRLGKEVEYARYLGVGHADWSLDAERDAVTRTLAWLDRFVGAGPKRSVTSASR